MNFSQFVALFLKQVGNSLWCVPKRWSTICFTILVRNQKELSEVFSLLTCTISPVPTHRKIPLISSPYRFCLLTKQAFIMRCLWWALLTSSSQTIPLCLATSAQLSFCQGQAAAYSASASPQRRAFWVGATALSLWLRAARAAEVNQRSKPQAHSSLQSLSPDLHNSS